MQPIVTVIYSTRTAVSAKKHKTRKNASSSKYFKIGKSHNHAYANSLLFAAKHAEIRIFAGIVQRKMYPLANTSTFDAQPMFIAVSSIRKEKHWDRKM